MKEKVLLGTIVAISVTVVALAATVGDISSTNEDTEDANLNTNTISIAEDQFARDDDIADSILDEKVREVLAKQIKAEDKIMSSDIQAYLSETGGVLKLTLDGTAKKLDGLSSLKNVKALRIENATYSAFDWDELSKMENLQSLTIVNSKLSPSDIASYIGHLVRNGHLQYLYINAAVPGKAGDKFLQIEETAAGLSGAYTTALNDLGDRNSGKNQLKVLSLVGNNWQGDIASFTKLKESGCQIALDANAHAIMTDDYNEAIINVIN